MNVQIFYYLTGMQQRNPKLEIDNVLNQNVLLF